MFMFIDNIVAYVSMLAVEYCAIHINWVYRFKVLL